MKHIEKINEWWFLNKNRNKPKIVKPEKTMYGLTGAIIDPLSFIAEHFGEVGSKYKIVGLKDKSKKYMLYPWLDDIEKVENKQGWITGKQIVAIGIEMNYLELDERVAPLPGYSSGRYSSVDKFVDEYILNKKTSASKINENKNDCEVINDMFTEYSDKYDIERIEDLWLGDYNPLYNSVYTCKPESHLLKYGGATWTGYLLSIRFSCDFGRAGSDGYLSEEFQSDMESFTNRLESIGYDSEIDWSGGEMYQIKISKI